MQCHTCHVLSNDAAAGVNKQPKGPNLTMTYRLIQRKWARHWLQDPPTIQPGNPMASIFFSGRGIQAITDPNKYVFTLNGLPYIPSDRNPESIRSVQYEFGDTVDQQEELVLDFIYAAGFEGYTSKDPPQGEPKLTPAPKDAKLALLPGFTAPLPEPEMRKGPTSRPTTPGAGQVVAANTGPSITGKVIFVGTPPPRKAINMSGTPQCANHPANQGRQVLEDLLIVDKGGGLKNAVVSVKNPPAGRFAPPAQAALLDQRGCHYDPHILAVMTGQQILIRNSDPFLHNVHALPQLNPGFNFGQNNVDPGRAVDKPMTTPEEFRVKCDVHPWMNCQFVVFNHPFFAVTADDGTYTINGLPPGTYTVTVWHEVESLRSEQQITVPAGKPAEANFSVKME